MEQLLRSACRVISARRRTLWLSVLLVAGCQDHTALPVQELEELGVDVGMAARALVAARSGVRHAPYVGFVEQVDGWRVEYHFSRMYSEETRPGRFSRIQYIEATNRAESPDSIWAEIATEGIRAFGSPTCFRLAKPGGRGSFMLWRAAGVGVWLREDNEGGGRIGARYVYVRRGQLDDLLTAGERSAMECLTPE